MSDLKQMMKNKFDENRGLLKEVAIAVGLDSSSTLSKWLDDPRKELADFNVLVSTVKYLYPDKEYDLISEHSLTLDPKKQASRQALEYADVNHLGELADRLIIRLKEAKNATSNEWAAVYELHRKLSTGEYSVLQANDRLCGISIKSDEMKVFSKVMFLYQYLNKREFNRLDETISYINMDLVEGFSSEYVKNSYRARILMLKANACLFDRKLEETRKYVNECLEITDTVRFLAFGYMNMGNTYMFESYDKAKEFFLKGLESCQHRDIYKYELKLSLSFLANYWGKENKYLAEYSDDADDLQEIAFWNIKNGNKEKALEILNSTNKDDLDNFQLAFDSYFRGLITLEKDHFYDSIEYFILAGDKFYRTAPLIELKKLGESERSLKIFAM
ncbi:AimR family lysis-lysogeny pheromone receptor [uncultured Metabacillus sp.]|uniref:AimR family lysis-lysogeny pheromone receptor n=1 Tax=uncultured Metabacillus sp. TaxID=2860135 RepID=UPI002619F932|nr:AimR family lysis-lysogeny pheromone receptor [uncultured Metabacillus sp.]